jgi:hypothetical protein
MLRFGVGLFVECLEPVDMQGGHFGAFRFHRNVPVHCWPHFWPRGGGDE